jgi:pyruvate,water dikinase
MTKKKSFVLPFSNIRAADLPLVGGKGANLGEMTHAGFPIPDGFCVTTLAFDSFMGLCKERNDIYKLLNAITSEDIKTVRTVGKQVRETLLKMDIPKDVADDCIKIWQNMGSSDAYSVRSSATAEDLPDASFAGQQDTYLNIIGESDLLDAIKRCWVSLFTDRAILYRYQNEFDHKEVKLSVVVQKMVLSEKSGILFTADPLTGHRHTLTIDASFGLGEGLVSGMVNPDAYRIDKKAHVIIDAKISEKNIAIFPQKKGGTYKKTLSGDQKNKQVLSESDTLKLAKIGCKIESHYNLPQDIEWAFADNQFYILQSRPITSLYPIDDITSPDDSLHIYFSLGHQQMMTSAMSPLSLSTIRSIMPLGRPKNRIESNIILQNAGRLFVDLTQALRHRVLKKVVFVVSAQFNALAPKTMQKAMQRKEFYKPHTITFSFSFLWGVIKVFFRVAYTILFQNLIGYIDKTNIKIDTYLLEVENKIKKATGSKKKLKYMTQTFGSIFSVILQWAPKFVAAEIAKKIITKLAHTSTKAKDIDDLSLGLSGNVVTEMNLMVGDLADLARLSPEVAQSFTVLDEGSVGWRKNLDGKKEAREFLQMWDEFLDKYGARGPSEIDIMVPRWYEDPLPLLQMIAGYLQKDAESHSIQHKKLVKARKSAIQKVLSSSGKGLFGFIRKPIIKRLIYVIEHVGGLREHHKFMVIRYLRIVKEDLKGIAGELVHLKKISNEHGIWFLSWPDLLKIWNQNIDMQSVIEKRKKDFKRFQKLTPPLIITSDGESPIVNYEVEDVPEGALVGNPVSSGVIEGIVRVIKDPQNEVLKPGEILVATFTDPGWTPLFINAGGLILEVGGIMTHGAVVAREYGIPAVVGVRDAVTKLQTGQRVRIDGDRGVIEVLD